MKAKKGMPMKSDSKKPMPVMKKGMSAMKKGMSSKKSY
jgi:hypothetical protein